MIDEVGSVADIFQIGTRNFQNYSLLDELGKCDIPILLKRGTWGTIDEILGACERILVGGNKKVAICLRGVVGMPSYRHVFPTIRWAPDLMMIPALKEITNIPIIYDPSHSTGYRNFVRPISRAAIAAGSDGLIIEAHPDPNNSISDPDQAIDYKTLKRYLMNNNLSIVIRTRNEERHIGHAIQSCIDNFDDPEIIIVDNKSKDDTLEVVSLFDKYNIKTVQLKSSYSPGKSLNLGIKNCTNETVLILSAHCQIVDVDLKKSEKSFEKICCSFWKSNPNI